MAQSVNLSDVLAEISPLIVETMNYELRIRGIQPAQAPTTKKAQLARELLKENQGGGNSINPFMSITEDLRCVASLFARFECSLLSTSRTTLSIENALTNLAFLKVRVERLNPTIPTDLSTAIMLNVNIDIDKAKAKNY